MSTEKKHSLTLTQGATMYLRNALNNPRWTGEDLSAWVDGCDIIRALPRIRIPAECQADDDKFMDWGRIACVTDLKVDDAFRDNCRKALKNQFKEKLVPVNEFAAELISVFNLKS